MASILRSLQLIIRQLKQWFKTGTPIQKDETVVLFPQSATLDQQGVWQIPVHAWVIELESDSVSRLLARSALGELFEQVGVSQEIDANNARFNNRVAWFLADREMFKKVSVVVDNTVHYSPKTEFNGHVKFTVAYQGDAQALDVLDFQLADCPEGAKKVLSGVQLVPPTGLSVISDIDDTIKISNVPDRKKLVKGIFLDDYKPTEGMPAFYQSLSAKGACFHYVSSSPWQLYPSLVDFFSEYYPFGSISQRYFYIADSSFFEFFQESKHYKVATIKELLQRYPNREFVLIGDSGELDPEIYLQIALEASQQIKGVFIREVYEEVSEHAAKLAEHELRWQGITQQLAEASVPFQVFNNPSELLDQPVIKRLNNQ